MNAVFLQHIFTGIPSVVSQQAAGRTAARKEQLTTFPRCPEFLRMFRDGPDVVLLLPLIMPGCAVAHGPLEAENDGRDERS